MDVSPDYEDLFKTLNAYKIKYLVVGAHAVMYYTEPRYTKDIDIWIIPDLNDSKRVFQALKEFGAPLTDTTEKVFEQRNLIFQIGVIPVRIDIMMDVPGVSFQMAWKKRKRTVYGKAPIFVMSREDLIQAKKVAGRLQDKLDVKKLKKQGK